MTRLLFCCAALLPGPIPSARRIEPVWDILAGLQGGVWSVGAAFISTAHANFDIQSRSNFPIIPHRSFSLQQNGTGLVFCSAPTIRLPQSVKRQHRRYTTVHKNRACSGKINAWLCVKKTIASLSLKHLLSSSTVIRSDLVSTRRIELSHR